MTDKDLCQVFKCLKYMGRDVYSLQSDIVPLLEVQSKHFLTCIVPSAPLNVQSLSGIVVWGIPEQPNGAITGYDVRFFTQFKEMPLISKEPFESYHIVTNDDITGLGSNISVQVSQYRLIPFTQGYS